MMLLRGYWHPTDGKWASWHTIKEGDLVALNYRGKDGTDFRFRPWRVHFVTRRQDSASVIVRPLDAVDSHQDLSFKIGPNTAGVSILPEHYSVCAVCGDLQPCREQMIQREVSRDAERAQRYETPGVCPSCGEVVTVRQKSITFPRNLYVPLGDEVTFHLRHRCLQYAIEYDRILASLDKRDPILSCTGTLVHHLDGEYTCSNPACPGSQVSHKNFTECYVLTHGCWRLECHALGARPHA